MSEVAQQEMAVGHSGVPEGPNFGTRGGGGSGDLLFLARTHPQRSGHWDGM